MENEVVAILKRVGSVITDSHFVGTSGRHMSIYVNKDALFPHTADTSRVGELFAEKNKDLPIDIVVGPALGGIILSQWTAFHLSRITGREILSVYTEKVKNEDGTEDQVFRRSYDKMVEGKNVLVLEDTTATGGSVKKVVNTVRGVGGNVVQVCVMVNRDPSTINEESIGAPFSWLAEVKADSYAEEECPLCKSGVPVNTAVGHGQKFLDKQSV